MEWLGDIGGLYDALRLIGYALVLPVTSFQLKAELLSQVFRFTESKRFAEKRKDDPLYDSSTYQPTAPENYTDMQHLANNMQWDFQKMANIPRRMCLATFFGCNRKSRYKKMLEKSNNSIMKELDLIKFIHRQRLTTFTTLASLTAR